MLVWVELFSDGDRLDSALYSTSMLQRTSLNLSWSVACLIVWWCDGRSSGSEGSSGHHPGLSSLQTSAPSLGFVYMDYCSDRNWNERIFRMKRCRAATIPTGIRRNGIKTCGVLFLLRRPANTSTHDCPRRNVAVGTSGCWCKLSAGNVENITKLWVQEPCILKQVMLWIDELVWTRWKLLEGSEKQLCCFKRSRIWTHVSIS